MIPGTHLNFTISMCSIWQNRNNITFAGARSEPDVILSKALHSWNQKMDVPPLGAGRSFASAVCNQPVQWSAPSPGVLKFNSDAAFRNDSNSATMAFLARDHKGQIREASWFTRPSSSALAAEAIALLASVIFAKSRGISQAIFESDSKVLVDALSDQDKAPPWEILASVSDIKSIVAKESHYSFSFVHREANRAVDWVVKHVDDLSLSPSWMINPPRDLAVILNLDACNVLLY